MIVLTVDIQAVTIMSLMHVLLQLAVVAQK